MPMLPPDRRPCFREAVERFLPPGRALLLAVAAPLEAKAVLEAFGADPLQGQTSWKPLALHDRYDLVVTGIGKVNAAGAILRVLDPLRHAAVLSTGVCGSLPGPDGTHAPLGAVVLGTASVYADEGLRTPDGFLTCDAMGFPLGRFSDGAVLPDAGLAQALAPLADVSGPIATVSTCSGTGAGAEDVAQRTGAVAEAMEGAAIGHALSRLAETGGAGGSAAFAELRVVSNTTGDRGGQAWDLRGALGRLRELLGPR